MSSGFNPRKILTQTIPALITHIVSPGTGMLSFPWIHAVAFTHSGIGGAEDERSHGNDVQIHLIPFTAKEQKLNEKNFGMTIRPERPLNDVKYVPDEGITLLPTLALPKSTGLVRLASKDPRDHPIIEPGYLLHKRDMDCAVRAHRIARKVASSPPLSDVLDSACEIIDPSIPFHPESDEYIRERIRRSCLTVYHPVGTAKMGADDDDDAVCDSKLRVRGVRGLRCADASVMPSIVSGNTNAPCIMIGEKAAAMIAQDWSMPSSKL